MHYPLADLKLVLIGLDGVAGIDKKQLKLKGFDCKTKLDPILKKFILDIIKKYHNLDDEQEEADPM